MDNSLVKRDEKGRVLAGSHLAPGQRSTALTKFRDYVAKDWNDIQDKLVALAKGGDIKAIEIVASRMVAAPKGQGETTHIPGLREATTLEAKGECIVNAVGDGLLSIEGGR